MGFWSRLFSWRRKSSTTAAAPASWFVDWVRGEETVSGVSVTPESAMRCSAVWSCVRIRSEDIAKLPCILYRRRADGGKDRATDHPLYALMHDQPNPRMTSFEFRQLMQATVDLRGNAYARKEPDGRGGVKALWPLNPTQTHVLAANDGSLFYKLPNSELVAADEIMHLRGLTLDGIHGLSPISHHRETIGLAVAAQRYGAAFFGNQAQPRGAIKVPGILGPEAAARLRADWEQKFQGPENAHRLAIFDGNMEWVQTGMSNEDAEYIDLRKFQLSDIARLYRIPPHKIGDLEKATFSNIEQQALEYVTDCLMSELVRWEQTLSFSLLRAEERADYFFEFLIDGLLRGDLKSRYEAFGIGRNWGWFNVDEIRARENMNPLPNGAGQIYLQPLNTGEAGKLPPPAPPKTLRKPRRPTNGAAHPQETSNG